MGRHPGHLGRHSYPLIRRPGQAHPVVFFVLQAGGLEATTGFEPVNKGFADPRLTTCLRRRTKTAKAAMRGLFVALAERPGAPRSEYRGRRSGNGAGNGI